MARQAGTALEVPGWPPWLRFGTITRSSPFPSIGYEDFLELPEETVFGQHQLSQGGAHGTELLAMTRPPGWSARHLFPLGPTQGSKVPCVRSAPAAAHSRGRALQLLSLPRVAEELQLPGQQRHLHGHRLVLLTVDAEGAPGALRRREDAAGSLPGRPLQPIGRSLSISVLFWKHPLLPSTKRAVFYLMWPLSPTRAFWDLRSKVIIFKLKARVLPYLKRSN